LLPEIRGEQVKDLGTQATVCEPAGSNSTRLAHRPDRWRKEQRFGWLAEERVLNRPGLTLPELLDEVFNDVAAEMLSTSSRPSHGHLVEDSFTGSKRASYADSYLPIATPVGASAPVMKLWFTPEPSRFDRPMDVPPPPSPPKFPQ
jgi:hypothetical protein